jgi:ribosomal-protein-alanine N-acetyltransferase
MLFSIEGQKQFFTRAMRYSDIDLVVKNEVAAYEYPWSKRNFIDCLQSGYQCWVFATKEEIMAHGVLSVSIGESHLLTLCVHPDHQRNGYGRRILTLLMERAYGLESAECFLEVRTKNEKAISLYKSFGFSVIGKRKNYYPGKLGREDAYIMSLTLPLL